MMLTTTMLKPLEAFVFDNWIQTRLQFGIDSYPYVHLNSGSAGIVPLPVLEKLHELNKNINSQPPYEFLEAHRELMQQNLSRLAEILGSGADELATVRNTTEAINMVLFGLPINKDDHLVTVSYEYPYAIGSMKQLSKKTGCRLTIHHEEHIELLSDEALIKLYEQLLADKPTLLLISHMTFREGRILPIKKITEMAHAQGTEVLLDAAHTFAQFPYDIKDLGVDYMATSLHKWMSAPHGSGMLYVTRDKQEKLMPPIPLDNEDEKGMEKFFHLGTRPFDDEVGLSYAIDYHLNIGTQEKGDRLFSLTKYWTDKVKDHPRIKLHTPIDRDHCCALAAFSIEGKGGVATYEYLMEKHGVHAKHTGYDTHGFVRVTPNIFTLEGELDKLVQGILAFAG